MLRLLEWLLYIVVLFFFQQKWCHPKNRDGFMNFRREDADGIKMRTFRRKLRGKRIKSNPKGSVVASTAPGYSWSATVWKNRSIMNMRHSNSTSSIVKFNISFLEIIKMACCWQSFSCDGFYGSRWIWRPGRCLVIIYVQWLMGKLPRKK